MLDSDVGNNILPAVRFYMRECDNQFESAKQERPVKYMAEFVRIEIPGDRNTIIETFASEYHRKTYPIQYARFKNENSDNGIQGTFLRDWALLNPAQASELKHYHFYTVEQVAAASDEQISKIGMMVGMDPRAFREKAKNFLAVAKESAQFSQQAEELKKRDQEIDTLKAQMAAMMAKMEEPQEAPKRGRKPKELQE